MINYKSSEYEGTQPVSIAVDEEALAKILRCKDGKWPHYIPLINRIRCATARVLTDALREKLAPEIAMSNAEYWMQKVYEWGKQDGAALERKAWERKLMELFGIRSSEDAR